MVTYKVISLNNRTQVISHTDREVSQPDLTIEPFFPTAIRDVVAWGRENPGAYRLWDRVDRGDIKLEEVGGPVRELRVPPTDIQPGPAIDQAVMWELATTKDNDRAKEIIDEQAKDLNSPRQSVDETYLRNRQLPILRAASWVLTNNEIDLGGADAKANTTLVTRRKRAIDKRITELEKKLIIEPGE
ncbi:hypothetical protein Rctr71_092 [Virus Rctr71]|nr:hypothetical protein Rctr71_092 [Virus Rctr71]